MLLSQNRHWRATRTRGSDEIVLAILREGLPEDWRELKEFRSSDGIESSSTYEPIGSCSGASCSTTPIKRTNSRPCSATIGSMEIYSAWFKTRPPHSSSVERSP
jgi:hypothetical protein